jgi:hypothetical protein
MHHFALFYPFLTTVRAGSMSIACLVPGERFLISGYYNARFLPTFSFFEINWQRGRIPPIA